MYNTHNCDVRKVYENLDEKTAFEKEKELIFYYRNNTRYRLTNMTDGGEGSSGYHPTEEIKQKISISNRRLWNNEKFKNKMIAIRNDKDGSYQSEEFKNKISALVRGDKNPNYQNFWTRQQKENLSIKQKNNPLYKNENNPNSKRIICIETGEIFSCVKYAMKKYNIASDHSMSLALNTYYRTAAGLHWVEYSENFLDEQYRFKYLVNALLSNSHLQPVICLEDKEIFSSITELSRKIEIPISKISYHLKKNNIFNSEDKTYLLLKDYQSRYMQ